MPEDFKKWPRYSKIEFKSNDKYERQAELWNYMARIILNKIGRSNTFCYEGFVKDADIYLNYASKIMGLEYKKLNKLLPILKDFNDVRRFENIDIVRIAEAVLKYVSLIGRFGY